jgi:hypothetical protein
MRKATMDAFESNSHSFIVKVWLEETAAEAGEARWRGYITHVPSGKKHYLKSLNEITDYIAPYLQEMGVKIRQSRSWFKRRKHNPSENKG